MNRFGPRKRTALWCASAAGQLQCVRALLRGSAKPDTMDFEGLTALHIAAAEGQAAVVMALLAARADTDMRRSDRVWMNVKPMIWTPKSCFGS